MNDTIFVVIEQALDALPEGEAQLILPLGAFDTEDDAKSFVAQYTVEEGFAVYYQEVLVR